MATITSQILIGSPHPNHDGIGPSHYLFLSENSRPAWILTDQNIFSRKRKPCPNKTWIPTVENMLEDAFLMIAACIMKNQEILESARSFCPKINSERVELYSEFEESQRNTLYSKCRELSEFPKLIISIFTGSTIANQLEVVNEYKMDIEVCSPVYSRLYSSWTNETSVEGSLPSKKA